MISTQFETTLGGMLAAKRIGTIKMTLTFLAIGKKRKNHAPKTHLLQLQSPRTEGHEADLAFHSDYRSFS